MILPTIYNMENLFYRKTTKKQPPCPPSPDYFTKLIFTAEFSEFHLKWKSRLWEIAAQARKDGLQRKAGIWSEKKPGTFAPGFKFYLFASNAAFSLAAFSSRALRDLLSFSFQVAESSAKSMGLAGS
ncbi:hypothetical protein FLSA109164_03055 [Flavobacterium saliperosum]|uniref:Uncharacterized protein n=1 Tax=Flavobacterium saliperosum TaxID=329186 RepID=A0A1G4W3J6_9FLAO|nr:hypothetical protein SAMN02927925_02244 [Flavobacterium saliperosum]